MVGTARVSLRDTQREIEIYDIARRYVIKRSYSEDIIEDFPGWAVTAFIEGRGSRMDYLFCDFMRSRLGVRGSARSEANRAATIDHSDLDLTCGNDAAGDLETLDALKILDPRSRDLVWRVIILGERLREVSADTGLTMARISQIVKAALITLRDVLEGS